MNKNLTYDISTEIDPVERVDQVQAKLEQRRRERQRQASADSIDSYHSSSRSTSRTGDEAAAKNRADAAAKKKRQDEERRREERALELRESRWITAGHKVREKRVEFLERVFFRLKADGEFRGTKQEFFDEGLAMLENKYSSTAKPES